jgi:hypothetical protein
MVKCSIPCWNFAGALFFGKRLASFRKKALFAMVFDSVSDLIADSLAVGALAGAYGENEPEYSARGR